MTVVPAGGTKDLRRTLLDATGPVLVVLALAWWCFGAPVVGGHHSFIVQPDAEDQTYAWMQELAANLADGHLATWDATSFSGWPLAGELQPGPYYPPNLVVAGVFGRDGTVSARAIDVLIIAHFVLAAAGMHWLLRQWRHARLAALAGAIVFAFGGAVATRAQGQPNIFFGLCWLPVAMACTARAIATDRWRWLVAAGGVLGLQVLAGHIQPMVHTALLVGGYLLVDARRRAQSLIATARRLALVGISVGVGGLVALPALVQARPWLAHADRFVSLPEPLAPGERIPYEAFSRQFILNLRGLGSLADPFGHPVADGNRMFVGAVALVVAAAGLLLADRAPGGLARARWLAGAAVVATVVALGHRTPLARLAWLTPVLADIREPARWLFVTHFVLAVLVAMGVDALASGLSTPLNRLRRPAVALAAIAVVLAAAAVVPRTTSGLAQVGLGLLALVVLAAVLAGRAHPVAGRSWVAPALVALLVIVAGSSRSAWTAEVVPSSWVEDEYAQTPVSRFLAPSFGHYRVMVQPSAGLPHNIGATWRIETEFGHAATMNHDYLRYLWGDWGVGSRQLDTLNVRYIVTRDVLPLAEVFRDPSSGVVVYERPGWTPRAYLRSDEGGTGATIEATGHVRLVSFEEAERRYEVTVGGSTDELIFAEPDVAGWRVTVDSHRVAMHRAVFPGLPPLLRAINLDPGRHQVVLSFDPSPLPFGL